MGAQDVKLKLQMALIIRYLIVIIGLVSILLSFQNCGKQNQVSSAPQAGTVTNTTSGSGIVDSGKIHIIAQPNPPPAYLGDTLRLRVAADSTGYFYQWRKDGVDIPGANTSVLNILNVTAQDSGDYSVIVSDGTRSEMSSTASVQILTPPTSASSPSVTVVPLNQDAATGATVAFTVNASGYPSPQFQWYFNGSIMNGEISNILVLSQVTAGMAGQYSVKIYNSAGQTWAGPTLRVTP